MIIPINFEQQFTADLSVISADKLYQALKGLSVYWENASYRYNYSPNLWNKGEWLQDVGKSKDINNYLDSVCDERNELALMAAVSLMKRGERALKIRADHSDIVFEAKCMNQALSPCLFLYVYIYTKWYLGRVIPHLMWQSNFRGSTYEILEFDDIFNIASLYSEPLVTLPKFKRVSSETESSATPDLGLL